MNKPNCVSYKSPKSVTSFVPNQPLRKVRNVWHSGQFQNGIQLYWHTDYSTANIREIADQLLNYIAGLKANSVSISFPIYTNGNEPSYVYANPSETPSPKQLGEVVAAAKARGFRVTIRPLINQSNLGDAWRGTIMPNDVSQWFQSYENQILSYAAVAKHYNVNEFVIGSELASLQSDHVYWQDLVNKLKASGYGGEISYDDTWTDLVNVPVDSVGIDTYPDINLSDSASVGQLSSALTHWFVSNIPAIYADTYASEIGIPAESGMFHHPWKWGANSPSCMEYKPSEQTKWFAAACTAAKTVGLDGIYYWMLDSNTFVDGYDFATEPTGTLS
jgi:hypothetical protein